MGDGERDVIGRTQHQVPPAWQAPSVIERTLYEAKLRGDWPAFFDVLAEADLFVAEDFAGVEADPNGIHFMPYWYSQVRANCLPVLTEGMLPAPEPQTVFWRTSLGWFADSWRDRGTSWVVISPGSPCEGFFPATPAHRALWQQHAGPHAQSGCGPSHPHMKLRALEGSGAAAGAMAHGLGLIALLSVNNGELWNDMGHHGIGYTSEKSRLKEWW